jgi:hypothetical protein
MSRKRSGCSAERVVLSSNDLLSIQSDQAKALVEISHMSKKRKPVENEMQVPGYPFIEFKDFSDTEFRHKEVNTKVELMELFLEALRKNYNEHKEMLFTKVNIEDMHPRDLFAHQNKMFARKDPTHICNQTANGISSNEHDTVCQLISYNPGQIYRSHITDKVFKASGIVFVCEKTGRCHVCDKSCQGNLFTTDGTMCSTSGFRKEQVLKMDSLACFTLSLNKSKKANDNESEMQDYVVEDEDTVPFNVDNEPVTETSWNKEVEEEEEEDESISKKAGSLALFDMSMMQMSEQLEHDSMVPLLTETRMPINLNSQSVAKYTHADTGDSEGLHGYSTNKKITPYMLAQIEMTSSSNPNESLKCLENIHRKIKSNTKRMSAAEYNKQPKTAKFMSSKTHEILTFILFSRMNALKKNKNNVDNEAIALLLKYINYCHKNKIVPSKFHALELFLDVHAQYNMRIDDQKQDQILSFYTDQVAETWTIMSPLLFPDKLASFTQWNTEFKDFVLGFIYYRAEGNFWLTTNGVTIEIWNADWSLNRLILDKNELRTSSEYSAKSISKVKRYFNEFCAKSRENAHLVRNLQLSKF